MDTILDLLLFGIIIVCGWTGYKKGIIMGIGGILVIIVAVYGANLLANTFSYEVLPVMRPFASGYIESRINEDDKGVLAELGYDDVDLSLRDLIVQHPDLKTDLCKLTFERFGLSGTVTDQLTDETLAYSKDGDTDLIHSIAEILCRRLSFVVCFLLAFILIAILLTVIGNLSNLSFKIPGIDLVNDIGGAVLGVITGVMFCFVAAWVLKYTGLVIKEHVLADTWLTSMFIEKDVLTQYIGV